MIWWLKFFSIESFLTWVSLLLMTYKHHRVVERYQILTLTKADQDLNCSAYFARPFASWERGCNEKPQLLAAPIRCKEQSTQHGHR